MVTGVETASFEENKSSAVASYTGTDPERDTLTWSVTGQRRKRLLDLATGAALLPDSATELRVSGRAYNGDRQGGRRRRADRTRCP